MAAPLDVKIVGTALNSLGFTGENTIDGVGLNTFGFLWPCASIWTSSEAAVTTVWVEATNTTGVC